jgi:hypothetical protein
MAPGLILGLRALAAPPSEQQLQQLCSCCPAVNSLVFELPSQPTTAVLLPLRQLSALTHLQVNTIHDATVVAAVISAIAQLTGLKLLALPCLYQPSWTTPAAKAGFCTPLTGLTALQQLRVHFEPPAYLPKPQQEGARLALWLESSGHGLRFENEASA